MTIRVALIALVCSSAVAMASAEQAQKKMHAMGRVTTVAANSIGINTGAKSLTFDVDPSTTVVGKGVGTKSREMKTQGKSATLIDLVEQYDNVVVEYLDAGEGKLRATRIDIRSKRTKTP